MRITLKVPSTTDPRGFEYPVVEMTAEEWHALGWGWFDENLSARVGREVVAFRVDQFGDNPTPPASSGSERDVTE